MKEHNSRPKTPLADQGIKTKTAILKYQRDLRLDRYLDNTLNNILTINAGLKKDDELFINKVIKTSRDQAPVPNPEYLENVEKRVLREAKRSRLRLIPRPEK